MIDQFNAANAYIEAHQSQGGQAIILDNRAMAYLFGLGIYNSRFDMLVRGNVGYNGTTRIINEFKKMDNNTVFLVGKTKRQFEMTSLKVFVMCNYDYIEDISEFYIYKKKSVNEYKMHCDSERVMDLINQE